MNHLGRLLPTNETVLEEQLIALVSSDELIQQL